MRMVHDFKRRRLAADDEGAILIAGIFVTAFLAGALYLLIGASTSMQHGERMQDGADSAAFSAAQIHAKGMNLIALNNMVKLSATVTLMSIPAIAAGVAETTAWIGGSWWRRFIYGWTLPFLAIPGVISAIKFLAVQPKLSAIIRSADDAQHSLMEDLPLITEQLVNSELKSSFSPPVTTFFLSPLRDLPVEAEPLYQTCARMTPFSLGIIKKAFKIVPLRPVKNHAIESATVAAAGFCFVFGKAAMIPTGDPGDEGFQVRAFAGGDDLSTTGERGVQIATWGRESGGNAISLMRDQLSRISFAQAEFFHSGPILKEMALWSMSWRARLRRFRWTGDSIVADCARRMGPVAACALLPQIINQMGWAIVH